MMSHTIYLHCLSPRILEAGGDQHSLTFPALPFTFLQTAYTHFRSQVTFYFIPAGCCLAVIDHSSCLRSISLCIHTFCNEVRTVSQTDPSSDILSSFYFEAAKTLDRLDAKLGSIKGVLATLPEKDRKRTAALVIETLKCEGMNHECNFACSESVDRQICTDSRDQCIKNHDRGT
jgi:hypothetical protein